MARYLPALFERLVQADPDIVALRGASLGTLEHLKDSIARDLEALLNTRTALEAADLIPFPSVSASVLNYGLVDFAGMCLTSDIDQKRICSAVKLAVERHEPRLHRISASLRLRRGSVNRIDFIITAKFKAYPAADAVHFDAVLEPSSQQYVIRKSGEVQEGAQR